ncbi:RNA polymerase sigma factor [Pseudomarimonas arenosa]|uniref:Sigma-70 family RNA polymerase sigma factor n=1 Tax=Pseudomarimonas arenosa TaxID=2774145 RepID=A0AAW3ZFF4_9GAMM|nr:sigma-70 family RNA polymerase sigma factor [Pseudomarimonas arenosa]MBD8524359.1 sigma-70 family RNA polymerase sigma factor [Pseudomarimonas arenosa]
MDTPEPDSTLEALSSTALNARLALTDWENDTEFVKHEQVFRLFRRANDSGDRARAGQLSAALSRRLLRLSKGFAVQSGIYPGNIDNLDQAAEEISQFVWECLVARPKDAAHAEEYFGQLFTRRAIDFQRRLLAKKRKCQDSLDALDQVPEDVPDSWSDPAPNPEVVLATKQEHALIVRRMQAILTKQELSTYVMLYVEEMPVKDIAASLGVTPRTVNNYKNAALDKICKEFTP